jgi:hypothetical protein
MKLALILALLLPLFAQAEDSVLSSYALKNPDAATMVAVGRYFDLDHRRGDTFELIVPESQAALLLAIAPQAVLTEQDTAAATARKLAAFRAQAFLAPERYHSFEEVQAWMKKIAFTHSTIARVVNYGTSAKGLPLLALRISEGNSAKPVLMLTAATHGDELITTEVLMRIVDKLIAGYGEDERLTKMIERHDLYFVPVVNPDGFTSRRRHDGAADPNRSYPFPGRENATPTASIAGIIKLFETIKPVGSIDFHAFGEMIMYPWAYTREPIEESAKARMHELTGQMAAINRYAFGQISKVIYVAQGSSADYYFWKSGTTGLAIEMGNDKVPSPAEIPAYVEAQTESTWRFIEAF